MTKNFIIIIASSLIFSNYAYAGNFGIGGHSGYGSIKYKEHTYISGDKLRSEASLNTVTFGVSGEYTFERQPNFFTGITTDWVVGSSDDDRHKKNGREFATNDLRISGQFYDVRLGYKNERGRFYYRLYVSGGWDGIYFRRFNLAEDGQGKKGFFNKDISLWRAGTGTGLGYKFGKWAVDARAAYSYYPKGTVSDSNFSGVKFRTGGTCLDVGLGIVRQLSERVSLYAGGGYTLMKLYGDREGRGAVLPESEIRMLFGIANLTYAF